MVDGRSAAPIRSRYGRELLLYFSLVPDLVLRDHLVDQLWPDETDIRQGRRRLSRELARVQSSLGLSIWDGGRDALVVDPAVTLTSDLQDLLDGVAGEATCEDLGQEGDRLGSLLSIIGRGALLPGHVSPWADRQRQRAAMAECRLRCSAVECFGATDPAAALTHAERWVELDPDDERANDAAARLRPLVHRSGRPHVQPRTRGVLDSPRGPKPGDGNRGDDGPPTEGLLWTEIAGLRTELELCGTMVETADCRRRLLVAIDDRLRQTGLHWRRQTVVDELRALGHGETDLRWRQAEIWIAGDDRARLDELLAGAEDLDPAEDGHAMLQIVKARAVMHYESDINLAVAVADTIVERTTSREVSLEARILRARAAELGNDIVDADLTLAEAIGEAEEHRLLYYQVLAVSTLGGVRISAGDFRRAEQLVNRAIELAEQLGSYGVLSAAVGIQATLAFREQRHGSATAGMERAAEIAGWAGDTQQVLRWRLNVAVAALCFGDLRTARHHIDHVIGVCDEHDLPRPYWMPAVVVDLVELEGGDVESAAADLDAFRAVVVATGNEQYTFQMEIDVVRRSLRRQAAGDALAASQRAMYIADRHLVAEPWRVLARACLGAATVAAGRAQEGLKLLRSAAASVEPGGYVHEVHLWHHDAAQALGLEDEARGAALRGQVLLAALKEDLTEEQWQMAMDNVPEMARLSKL